jgi:hypothetical protein
VKKFDKQLDLESSEYRKTEAREPFWGFNAKHTLILFLAGLVVGPIVTRLVTGQFPYWVQHFLE